MELSDGIVWRDGAFQPNVAGVTDAQVEPDGVHLDIGKQGELSVEARLDLRRR